MAPFAGRPSACANSRWNWISSGCKRDVPEEGCLCPLALAHQFGECRDVAVAFDQRGPRADTVHELLVKGPNLFADRFVVAVDEQCALGIQRVTGEMDFPDALCG